MIIVRLKGGLGNQMFQYAFGLKLSKELNTPLKLDLSALLDRSKKEIIPRNFDLSVFGIQPDFVHSPELLNFIYKTKSSSVTKWVRKRVIGNKPYIKEPHFHYAPELVKEAQDNAVYEGWFQSQKYFSGVEDEIRKAFTFKNEILPESEGLLGEIERSNSICLNVRRTDFVQNDNLNSTGKNYFSSAAIHLSKSIEKPMFFVFSDDIDWCRKNIQLNDPVYLVEHSHKGERFSNYLRLMSHCKHFIIPNSSFAWWAVWLSQHEHKQVVAPKNWFNDPAYITDDLIPADWTRI